MIRYLDIFAGAGGLSEGFIRAGYSPVAHVEMDEAACYTLKTRAAYYWLKNNDKLSLYEDYLYGRITREKFYGSIPNEVIDSVMQITISDETIEDLFAKIDLLLGDAKLDLVVGGPPCQAYSLAGRSRDKNKMVGDPRNYLYLQYARFLDYYKPRYFVFENVIGLLSAKDLDGEKYLDKIKKKFREVGYSVEVKLLNAHDYGVLQNRKRVILIGKRGEDEHDFYPVLPLFEKRYIVNDLLSDLPSIKSGSGSYRPSTISNKCSDYLYETKIREKNCNYVTYHISRPNNDIDLEIYKLAIQTWNDGHKRIRYNELPLNLQKHKNTSCFVDRYKVIAGDAAASQTIVAHIAKDGHYFIHPDLKQNRSITPREAARIQTFPDNYYFESVSGQPSRSLAFKQIGNAVPVVLAETIANALKREFEKE